MFTENKTTELKREYVDDIKNSYSIEAVPKKAQNTLEFRVEIHDHFTVPS